MLRTQYLFQGFQHAKDIINKQPHGDRSRVFCRIIDVLVTKFFLIPRRGRNTLNSVSTNLHFGKLYARLKDQTVLAL